MFQCDVTASDPRLTGRCTETVDADCYPLTPSGTGCATVIWGTFDGPGWSGSISGTTDPAGQTALRFVETGTGANTGWTFIGSITGTGGFSGPLYQGPPPLGWPVEPFASPASE